MALTIEDPEADDLARKVASLTGESVNDAVKRALAERLEREQRKSGSLADRIDRIAEECSRLPVLDPRSPDELVGYDESGLPH